MSMNDLKHLITEFSEEIETTLSSLTALTDSNLQHLRAAIHHGLFGSAKRVRATLLVLTTLQYGGNKQSAIKSACALEMVHAASLIFDDMPAMDNSRLRRGQPAVYCAYGEGTAILSGIALLNLAFEVISKDDTLSPDQRLAITQTFTHSIGLQGLVAGQHQDLSSPGADFSQDEIEEIHSRKTGALFKAALKTGGIIARATPQQIEALHMFGHKLGIAFQTLDDLLDAFGSQEQANKNVRSDKQKPTLVALLGREQAETYAKQTIETALDYLSKTIKNSEILVGYTHYMMSLLEQRLESKKSSGA